MEIQVFEANNGACPYLDNRKWYTYMFKAEALDESIYESLLDFGFRRSGKFFYKNKCPNCSECISIRVLTDLFAPSKSQRRVWKRNQDIHVDLHPVEFDQKSYELYKKYSLWKHHSKTSEENYYDFLIESAVKSRMMKYYLSDKLVGIGWIDILPASLSSVYFVFDPDCHKRSLGVFSILKEIELAKSMQMPYLHLGFWVKNCQAMTYKQHFKPYQLLLDGQWQPAERVHSTGHSVLV